MARHSTHWKSAELIPSIEQKYLNLLQDGNDENQILTGSEATSTRRLSRVGFLYGDFPLKRMASDRRTASRSSSSQAHRSKESCSSQVRSSFRSCSSQARSSFRSCFKPSLFQFQPSRS
ncbi:uncharacterized protein LOC133650215 isoform X3 [Entelurus aequoreus]|uniref:uncharacterized protein LOC133650215 isoform X3 n=1 Tax=Entelurus aequoreus TaxID=161455 RepID=UPI002B1E2037|nr:uncharacterized protein LOC133650215 isoform X3 [Entelurus aequoreus]